jgi:hypothetical protein
MYNFIAHRYSEPKWQAYVTPSNKAFTFSDNTSVSSLLELKHALSALPEDVVMGHIGEKNNDIVNWVEFVVGDKELAEELRKYNHRWGMLVALERQMMRTLSLPSYVAKRWLSGTELRFTFVSGETVSSLEDLSKTLGIITDATVEFHGERVPNDISKWVADVIGDYQLAEILEESSNREQMKRSIDDHIDMLKEAAEE